MEQTFKLQAEKAADYVGLDPLWSRVIEEAPSQRAVDRWSCIQGPYLETRNEVLLSWETHLLPSIPYLPCG